MNQDADFATAIHDRLLAGDYTAPSALTTAYLPVLVARLRARHPEVRDETMLSDAATDALLEYCEFPARYSPARSSLLGFLTMAAERDLLNALEKVARRRRRESSLDVVEDDRPSRNEMIEDESATTAFTLAERDDDTVASLSRELSTIVPDARDRKIVRLILDGERDTAAYARVLGIEDHEPKEQERTVKRHKDRLKKRLERLGARLRERAE